MRLAHRMKRLQPLPHRLLSATPLHGFWTIPCRITCPRRDGPYLWGAIPMVVAEMVQYGPVEDASDREDLESSGRGSLGESEEDSSQDEDDDEDDEDSGDSDFDDHDEEDNHAGGLGGSGEGQDDPCEGGGGEDHDDPDGGGGCSPRSGDTNGDDDLYDYEFRGGNESYTDGITYGPDGALHDGVPVVSQTRQLIDQLRVVVEEFQEMGQHTPDGEQGQYRIPNTVNCSVDISQEEETEWNELMAEIERSRNDEPQARLTDSCGPTWHQGLDGIHEEEEEDGEEDRDRTPATHYCDGWERPVQQRTNQQGAGAPPASAPAPELSSSPSEHITPPSGNTVQTTDKQNGSLQDLAAPAGSNGRGCATRYYLTQIAVAQEEYLKRSLTARIHTKYTCLTPPELHSTGTRSRRIWGPLEPQEAWGNDSEECPQHGVALPFLRLPSPAIPAVGGGEGGVEE
ncbi:hypothetical protein DFP73DRAFT_564244 [Morchella snyderi]|nr:hypothetical protein DFP73DRAFT_564244 [Morchella snyderi]